MLTKKITCIECPKGCSLSVDIENCRVIKVSGNECPKGEKYAVSEIEDPLRILTAVVLSQGLELKMVPVRTDKPIPKAKMQEAMAEVKTVRIDRPGKTGDVIIKDLLGLGANLIATRDFS